MEIFVERGASRGDCVSKIAEKYGGWFHILREKKIRTGGVFGLFTREGVEIEFYIPPRNRNSKWQNTAAPVSPPVPAGPLPLPSSALPAQPLSPGLPLDRDNTTLDFIEAKKRVLAAAGKDPDQFSAQADTQAGKELFAQQQILDKLQEIQAKIDQRKTQKEDHPSLVRATELLKLNDFSDRYIANMIERARKELPLDTLENFDAVQDRLLEWIGESITIYNEPILPGTGRIMGLVGPTGVGKTTTIAKLAAVYGIGKSGRPRLSVRMITIDAFRIGAWDQIEKYSDIMEIPVSRVDNQRDLRREIALYQEGTDLILIDTIGKSPKDSAKLGEMKELLDVCGSRTEIHLVLSAGTKTRDIEEILRQFEPFNYCSVILTKMDETSHIGNVISALAERGKSISYVTDGQTVPTDIKKASVVRFLINLDEFKVDREKMEKRFPVDEADQFQWS
ncbi:MAG: flagellar biosynthesis protein FlhF [Treponema sp.]|jgi:flagellar biosynthesis protein FlhF|nr:flagellar biosynthesis protein FlhF [Treponema sp.]